MQMDMLLALKNGQNMPVINYVCIDVVTEDNAAQFLK
jgi:hypothetical protein